MSEAVAFFAFIPRVRKCRLLNNPSWHQHCLRHSSVSGSPLEWRLFWIAHKVQRIPQPEPPSRSQSLSTSAISLFSCPRWRRPAGFWGSALAERLWGMTVHNHRCRILFRIGCPSVSFRRRMTFERFFSRGRQSKLNCNHWHGPTAESIALDNDVASGLLTEALFGTFCVRYRGTGYTLLLYSRHSTE